MDKEKLYLVNDFLAACFYLIGSLCHLFGVPSVYGNILFVLGSILFILPPAIKLFKK